MSSSVRWRGSVQLGEDGRTNCRSPQGNPPLRDPEAPAIPQSHPGSPGESRA